VSDHVRSLERGLAVLRAFDADAPVQTLSDVSRRAGLTRAAARRFLLTLAELGYVRVEGRHFSLSPKVLELGYAYLSALSLPEVAGPHLEALSARVHESASMSVLDGADVVYVARVATSRLMTAAITIGTRLPAYATAMGRVLLAARPPAERARLLPVPAAALTDRTVTDAGTLARTLDEVAAAGWALVDEELELGVRSIAVPVRGAEGVVIAAANVAVRPGTVDLVADVLPHLQACVAAVEADLRAGRPAR
jgi:IclR family pca regulon transcriptional regulator